ncbi:MAG: toprim domain-containing protein, partial [Casimicrobiaceae bacterium]
MICIAEGFATGASIHEATGHAVAVAFNAANLAPVAVALRDKLPDVRMIVCADDDYRTDGNPGMTKAREAALAVSGLLAIPDFGDNRPEGATDFNDCAQHAGIDAVKRAVANAGPPDVSTRQDGTPNATATDPAGDDWPEPQPLGVAEDTQAYPTDALPDGIQEAVAEVVAFVQCPPALAGCSALSALSLAAQGLAN